MEVLEKKITLAESELEKTEEKIKQLEEKRNSIKDKLTNLKNQKAAYEMENIKIILGENGLKITDILNAVKSGEINQII
ncbi:hypothetical protein FDC58_14930 [Clostridium botulinum]|uniref:Uncharacterized protein n=1 Tax=Clostridium botulinum TaxID=1491 RepID=A0A0A0UUZ1_CLOBO|nr:hypothetical protein [Clostridium botulinum]AIW54619.1 hypothetical protein [Clostridium botulinum]AIW54738.1 hypothetical protein [Clostridium botulinum]AIW54868.1 hypothetical protein [Clostridium botulinum]MBY7009317.1 hypothetical protein [Clostridium botulinum]NFH74455.1 hypothetical protein [Clostridium botulinum]